MSNALHSEQQTGERFVFIDALRGVAAVAVLLHHLLNNTVMTSALNAALPWPVRVVCAYGAFGVQIFFVMSGFVIAYSLRNVDLSLPNILNFILRRQIRLDPPYWCTIGLVLAVMAMERSAPQLVRPPMPGLGTFLINLCYLQMVSHVPYLIGVAWTLCIEIQFYLVFIALLAAGQGRGGRSTGQGVRLSTVALIFSLGIVSMLVGDRAGIAWFIGYWFYFAAGVLCCWSMQRQIHTSLFVAFIALMALSHAHLYSIAAAVGGITAVLIFGVGRAGTLTRWLGGAIFQYFGRISYSLYLVHLTVLSVILRAGYKLTGENRMAALGWFILAGAASIAVAHCLHIGVERPSMRLASRLKLARQPAILRVPAAPVPAAVPPPISQPEDDEDVIVAY